MEHGDGRFVQNGCNMGTVLMLHKQNKMQHKNRPHIAPLNYTILQAIALIIPAEGPSGEIHKTGL